MSDGYKIVVFSLGPISYLKDLFKLKHNSFKYGIRHTFVLYLQLVKPLQCLDYLTPSTHHKIESLSSLPRTTMWRSCLRPLINRIKNGVKLKKQIYSNKSMNYLRSKISNKFHNFICNCHSSLIKLMQNEWCWVFSLYV